MYIPVSLSFIFVTDISLLTFLLYNNFLIILNLILNLFFVICFAEIVHYINNVSNQNMKFLSSNNLAEMIISPIRCVFYSADAE